MEPETIVEPGTGSAVAGARLPGLDRTPARPGSSDPIPFINPHENEDTTRGPGFPDWTMDDCGAGAPAQSDHHRASIPPPDAVGPSLKLRRAGIRPSVTTDDQGGQDKTTMQNQNQSSREADGDGGQRGLNRVLRHVELQVERKKLILTYKENDRGKFLRISEEAGVHRNTIIIPASGLPELIRLLSSLEN